MRITVNVDPIAFNVGSVAVPWYAITLLIAIGAVVTVTWYEARRLSIAPSRLYSVAVWAIPGGLLGARLVHVLDQWGRYATRPGDILRLEGWALYGAILGVLVAVWLYTRSSERSFGRWCDVLALGAPLGQAIGRVGCTIQGCCYGLPTSLPWAVVYTHPRSYAPLEAAIHPAPAYFVLWNLAIFAVLIPLRHQMKAPGCLFLTYLALYAAGDFGLRFLRQADSFVMGLHQAQVVGLLVLAVALPLLATRCGILGKGRKLLS